MSYFFCTYKDFYLKKLIVLLLMDLAYFFFYIEYLQWAHWRCCPVAAVVSSKWMLHTGGGWGETPLMTVKRFGCTKIHNKALYKYLHSFIHSFIQCL